MFSSKEAFIDHVLGIPMLSKYHSFWMQGISKLSDDWMHQQTIKAKRRNQIKNLMVKRQKTWKLN